jgi:hypothetical protein
MPKAKAIAARPRPGRDDRGHGVHPDRPPGGYSVATGRRRGARGGAGARHRGNETDAQRIMQKIGLCDPGRSSEKAAAPAMALEAALGITIVSP